jgi:hypothetical protein
MTNAESPYCHLFPTNSDQTFGKSFPDPSKDVLQERRPWGFYWGKVTESEILNGNGTLSESETLSGSETLSENEILNENETLSGNVQAILNATWSVLENEIGTLTGS